MKKTILLPLFLGMFFVFLMSAQAKGSVCVKYGADVSGNIEFSENSVSSETGVKAGSSFGIEILNEFTMDRPSELGLGVSYLPDRSLNGVNNGSFSIISVYVIENIYFSSRKTAVPYLSALVGYDWLDGDPAFQNSNSLKGGLYAGLGAGIGFGKPRFEFYHIVASGTRGNESMEYTRDSVTLVYKF
jgi:hypothetical protein